MGLSAVEWGGVGLGSAGERLGMHWGAIKLLYYMPLILLFCQAKTKWGGVGLGSAGEGLGMHWGAIKLLYTA